MVAKQENLENWITCMVLHPIFNSVYSCRVVIGHRMAACVQNSHNSSLIWHFHTSITHLAFVLNIEQIRSIKKHSRFRKTKYERPNVKIAKHTVILIPQVCCQRSRARRSSTLIAYSIRFAAH